ncbi:single-strand DNA endonuclease ASTE1-like [Glandiceps talaboti]
MPRGLTTFITNNSSCLQSHELHDTRVVMDGKWLAHWFFFNTEVDFTHGGDYKEYAVECTQFFQSFQRCNITPYVLLDGADYLDDKKFGTLMDRAQQKVDRSFDITQGGDKGLRPMFAMNVFIQVLNQLNIHLAVCDFEADDEIVNLANAFNCPVIGEDSDFFIFDVRGGYIPMKYLKWKESNAEGSKSMRCEIYTLKEFCNEFKLQKEMLPILSILLGNDFIPREVFDDLYHGKIKRQVNIPPAEGVRVRRTIAWLAKQRSVHQVTSLMIRSVSYSEPDIEAKINDSIELYRTTNASKLEKYFQNKSNMVEIPRCPLPEWALGSYRKGSLSPSVINVRYQRKTFINACIEDIRQPSCSNVSLPIRQVIYGILLQRDESSEEGDIEEGAVASLYDQNVVTEIDRKDRRKEITEKVVTVVSELENYGQLPALFAVASLDEADKKKLMMEVLDVNTDVVEGLSEDLQLPIAITMYWKKKAIPEVSKHILRVLLLGMAIGHFGDETTEAEVENLDPPPAPMDLEMVQALAQWQNSMYFGLQLNSLLNQAYPIPDVTQLYNGTLLHRLHATSSTAGDVEIEWARENLLNSNAPAQQLFVKLVSLPW